MQSLSLKRVRHELVAFFVTFQLPLFSDRFFFGRELVPSFFREVAVHAFFALRRLAVGRGPLFFGPFVQVLLLVGLRVFFVAAAGLLVVMHKKLGFSCTPLAGPPAFVPGSDFVFETMAQSGVSVEVFRCFFCHFGLLF